MSPVTLGLQTLACTSGPVVPRQMPECSDTPAREPSDVLGGAIARNCPPEAGSCSADYGILVGSAEAGVLAFYTRQEEQEADTVGVAWTCPEGSGKTKVRVTLFGEKHLWKEEMACSEEHYVWRLDALFRSSRNKPLRPLVELLIPGRTVCTIRVPLLARFRAPSNYYLAASRYCGNLDAKQACVVIGGQTGSWKKWEIKAGLAERDGPGRMGYEELSVPITDQCQNVEVFADFDRQPNREKRTCIAELHF